ncbi:MAG TPA: TonB-dependent receptor, partial [Balneolaceae bacterium]|nr:TonB-dependent receptor [Balneolaceae bacterium]
MRYLLPVLILFFFWDISLAQLKAELDTIDVSASRITTSISESGKNVSVITQSDIQDMPVSSVDELLRSLPGININARAGFGVQSDVGVRGSTFSQVMFLLDNTPLNDPLTAHFNTNIPVALSEIA